MKISKTGYKKNSKDKNQPSLLIPSNQITMKGVEFPVFGMDDTGHSQMMYPGMDYSFPGNYVYEKPMKNWLNKYQDGGELKPMTWTEYLDSLGINDPKLRSIDPKSKLDSGKDEGGGQQLKYDRYWNASMQRPHANTIFEDVDNLKAAKVIDMYNALFWNREKQDYSGSDYHKFSDLPSDKIDLELSSYADHSMYKKDALNYIKNFYNSPAEDILPSTFNLENSGSGTRAVRDVPIEYTHTAPRADLTMYNNPNWEKDNPLFSEDKSLEVFGTYDSMPLSEPFARDWKYEYPKGSKKTGARLEFQEFPKPTYNYINVPKRYDEKGNEVVSKYDVPNPKANTYYDFSGSLTEDIYKQKNKLHQIYKQNVANLKKFDPNAYPSLPMDRNLRREYIEKEYASDPYLFYGDQNGEDKYCTHCEKLSGSQRITDNNIDFFKFKPQYPSSREWLIKTSGAKPPRPIYLSQPNATSTGQVQIGWDIWDPKLQQWKAKHFSTEEIDKRREEVKVPKDGGVDVEFKDSVIHDLSPYSLPSDTKVETVTDTNNKPVITQKQTGPKVIKAPTFQKGGWLNKYQVGNEVTPGMWPSGQKRSDYVPYKDTSGAPYEIQDPYIHNYSTVDVPENLSELPSYRLYTYGKNDVHSPFSKHISRPKPNAKPINEYGDIGVKDLEYVPYFDEYTYRNNFDPKTGYNYELNPENLQPYQSIPMEEGKEFNLRRFLLNTYEGQPQTHDIYIKKDGTVDKENFIPTSYSREETMDNIFKDLYAQNLHKFKGDRDAAYNATSEFMKDRVEPQYKGAYYDYMTNPNVSAEDKLNINLKGSHMTVDPVQTEDYVRQTITNKIIEEHPEYMEKDESGNYKMSDEDFSNLVKSDPRYRKKLNEYNDVLQDWYVTNKNMSAEEAKTLVEKDLYKNVSSKEKKGPRVIQAPTFKSGGWLNSYKSNTPAWSRNPEGNWVVKAQKGLQYTVEPTRADSLQLLKNTRLVQDYYNSNNYEEREPSYFKTNEAKEWALGSVEEQHKTFVPEATRTTPSGRGKVSLDEYYKPVDQNKFYQREYANGILDTRAPMQLYDRRIQPTTEYTYTNIVPNDILYADGVAILGYDPISITPWDMLTDAEKKLRVKRFGRNGVPDDYAPDRPPVPKNLPYRNVQLLQQPEDRLVREYTVQEINPAYRRVYDHSPYSTKEYGPEGKPTHWAKEDEKLSGTWRPIKGTPSDLFVSKKVKFQKGGFHQKIYTDSREFAKANKLYNDSLDLYTRSRDFNKKNIPHDNYNSFTIPYDDVLWTAGGSGGYFIDTPFGRNFLGKSGVFSVPGSEHNKIFTESFTNKIKPIGFDTVDWPYPVYKKPTQEPVYEEIKNLPYLDAKFELPELKLDIGKPSVKSQGIRIRPMMTADQATSTGQYQSGKYMWDPETKSWKVKMLSPETQKENKEEVKLKSKKNGGWLNKYQDAGEVIYVTDPEAPTFKSGGWLEQYQDGRQYNKYDIMSGVYDDMRQAAVPSTTYVDIPAPTEKEVKAVQAEAQRVKKKMKQTGAKSEAEVYAKEKAEKEFQNAAATIAANQGVIDVAKEKTAGDYVSQAWDIASNPATALGYKVRGQEIPWGFTKGEKNALDTPLSLINPATYINAAGRLVDAAITPETYTQVIPQTIGATAMTLSGDQYPESWDENAWKMLGLGLDAAMLKGNPFRMPGKYAIGYQSPSGARAALGDLEYIAANNPKLLGSLETPGGKWALSKANPITETGLSRFVNPIGAQGSASLTATGLQLALPGSQTMRALPGSPNVPDEFMVQARAAGAQGPAAPQYFSNDEVKLQVDQINNYMEARKAFNKKYDPQKYLFDENDPIANFEMREEMFNLLYPNVKLPNFNSKEYLPNQFNYVNELLRKTGMKSLLADTPFLNNKLKGLDRVNLENKLLKDSVKSEQPGEFMYMDDLRQEARDPDSYLNTDPRGYLDEFEALPKNADELTDQQIRDLAERKHMARIMELEMKIQEKYGNNTGYTNLISTGQIPFRPEGMNSILPTSISNKVNSMPLVKEIKKGIADAIDEFVQTPTGSAIDAHLMGLQRGLQEFKSKEGRPLKEIFPVTKAEKQKVLDENKTIYDIGKKFYSNWVYGNKEKIRPEVALKIQNILSPPENPINYIPNYTHEIDLDNPFMRTRDRIVNTRDINSNQKLRPSDIEIIKRRRSTAGGVNFSHLPTDPVSLTFGNFGYYGLPKSRRLHTFIHELGHTYQDLGAKPFQHNSSYTDPIAPTWGGQIAIWDKDYGYYIPNPNTEIGKKFAEAMVPPVKGEGTWEASPNELHSELMVARFNLALEYMKQGKTLDEAINFVKQETDEQIDWMIENGGLNRFFKQNGMADGKFVKGASQETKRELIRLLPAAIPVGLGIGAAAASKKNKFQDGGMPLGLPLKEQNPYLVPEYNQPMANGYILPDPNRPELLNTGATEYKYSYGMDDRDVQVPSVVSGQYIGDKAFDRYMISGEEFKPMADPSSYSKFYDMTGELGLMRKKKGGVKSSAEGYYDYINGYSGIFANGGSKGWLDNYK